MRFYLKTSLSPFIVLLDWVLVGWDWGLAERVGVVEGVLA